MKKNILVIHPLKHHVYHSIEGIRKSDNNLNVFLGLYKGKSKILDLLLKITKKGDYIKGYYKNEISEYVHTDFYIELLYLLSKKNSKYNKKFFEIFQKKSKKFIEQSDIVHVLQDYCNESIRYASKKNKIIVYEQIIAFDSTIINYLEQEVKKWGFSNEYIERNYNSKKILLSKENIKNVNYILSPSRFVTESLLFEFGQDILNKIKEVPYGVDINKFKYIERKYNNKELKLLCVSRVTLTKGTQYLIEAMKRMEEYNVNLTYIGMPVDEEDKILVEQLKSLKNVEYIAKVPHYNIHNYFEDSDIFILPTLIEGSALSIYEALASGLPCITTKNSGSVIRDNKEGFIINNTDIKDIVKKVEYCQNNRDLLKNMSKNARERAELFSWDNYSKNIKNIYNDIINDLEKYD